MKSSSSVGKFPPLKMFGVREFEAVPFMYPYWYDSQRLAKINYGILSCTSQQKMSQVYIA